MKGDFDRTAHWPRPLDAKRAWAFVLDDEALAACSPHIEDVAVTEPGRAWTARLVSHMGRFSFTAPVEVRIRDTAVCAYMEVEAQGQDRRMGTRLQVDARLELERAVPATPPSAADPTAPDVPDPGVSAARLAGTYLVRGKAANLAPSIVHRHAELMVDAFWERFHRARSEHRGSPMILCGRARHMLPALVVLCARRPSTLTTTIEKRL